MPQDLPSVSQDIDPKVRGPLMRLIEQVRILGGFLGDPLDRALTFRDLNSAGMIDQFGSIIGGSGTPGTPGIQGPPGPPGGSPPAPDLTPPPTVTGLAAVAAISNVLVTWDAAAYTQGHGHLQTNIYAAKRNPGDPLPTFTDAVLQYEATGALTIAALPSDPNIRWHIWAKWKTNDGVESASPAGGTNGVTVTTGQDVTHLLQVLSGQISTSQLATALNTRINLVDASAGTPGSVDARIAVETTARSGETGWLGSLYTVRTQVTQNGRTVVGGFGLSGLAGGSSGPTIDFGVVANRFWVTAPAGSTGVSDVLPFVVQTTDTVVNGVTIPKGVYMDSAYINNLTAMWARIGTLFTDTLSTAQLNAANLTLGTGSVGGNLKSANFLSGSLGWLLQPNGNVEMNNAVVRGTVFANNGSFDGTVTIRDPNNGIVFQSGGNLAWSRVGGFKPKLFRVVAAGLNAIGNAPISAGLYDENGAQLMGAGRSYMLVRIRLSDGAVTFTQFYDVYSEGTDNTALGFGRGSAALAADLNATPNTHAVAVFTFDEPSNNRLANGLPAAMYRCGASSGIFGKASFQGRSAYILVGVAGCGFGNGFEQYQGSVSSDPNAWCDAAFAIQNGRLLTSGTGSQPAIDPSNITTYIAGASINLAQINTASIGSLSALTANMGRITAGQINFGSFTDFTWPPSGTGAHLSGNGLLLGNYNLGHYVQINESGDFFSPGMNIQAGVATFSGTLTAQAVNAVNTINIAGNAVTVPVSASQSSVSTLIPSPTTQLIAPAVDVGSGTAVLVFTADWTSGFDSGGETAGNNFAPTFYLLRNGLSFTSYTPPLGVGGTRQCTAITLTDVPGAGSTVYAIQASDNTTGTIGARATVGRRNITVLGAKR